MHVETLKTFCDLIEIGSLSGAAKLHRVTPYCPDIATRPFHAAFRS
jgi:hypothetical protein